MKFEEGEEKMKDKMDFLRQKTDDMGKKIEGIVFEVSSLTERMRFLEAQAQEIKNRRGVIENYLALIHRIGKDLLDIRTSLICKKNEIKKAVSANGPTNSLETEEKDLIESLRSVCGHQFVLSYKSWGGFGSKNYYDGYSGKRLCIVCGFEESPYNTWDGDRYKILVDSSSRLVSTSARFGPSRFYTNRDGYVVERCRETSENIPIDIWQPFEELLSIIEVGRISDALQY